MISRIDGVIFDWVGTTVDFGSFAPVKTFKETFEEHKLNLTIEEIRKPMVLSKIDHISTLLKIPKLFNSMEKYLLERT